MIEAGRVRRNFWQYREAMDLYSRAMAMAPEDWRPYRFRGHRHISVREFDRAVEDLEAARESRTPQLGRHVPPRARVLPGGSNRRRSG